MYVLPSSLVQAAEQFGRRPSPESRLTVDQYGLYRLMSNISEGHYCGSWMRDNEYALWRIATNLTSSRMYGRGEVSLQRITALRKLIEKTGGWIRWRDDLEDPDLPVEEWGPVFTPYKEWVELYRKKMGGVDPVQLQLEW